jgi:hypothetical protein
MIAITLNLEPSTELTHEQFYKLCMANKNVIMERIKVLTSSNLMAKAQNILLPMSWNISLASVA